MMEGHFLLWIYLLSAGWTAVRWMRKRDLFAVRYFLTVLATAGASAAGLASPRAYPVAFPAATAGFVLFLLLPGVLVRIARGAARRGRFRSAARLLAVARFLLPAGFLVPEEEIYRRAAADRDGPGTESLRRWLAAAPSEAAGPRALPATWVLVGAFLLLYLACIVIGGLSGPSHVLPLVVLGANEFRRVADGEWFRLFTAMFLHVGPLHLAMNVIAMLIVGRWVEPGIGAARTLVLFLLGGLLGNLASMLLYLGGPGPDVSAGASGGAMALIGAALVVTLRSPATPLRARRVESLVVIIGATIFIGFVEPGIANGAHLGGLAAGALLALPLTGRRALPGRIVRPAASLLCAATLASFAWMLTTLPSWGETREFRGPDWSFSGPAFFRGEGDRFDAGALGSLDLEVRAAPYGPEDALVGELARLMAAARGHPDTTTVAREGPERAGRWVRGIVRPQPPDSMPPVAVYALEAPDGARAVVIRIRPGDDDPELLGLLGRSVLETFTFR